MCVIEVIKLIYIIRLLFCFSIVFKEILILSFFLGTRFFYLTDEIGVNCLYLNANLFVVFFRRKNAHDYWRTILSFTFLKYNTKLYIYLYNAYL